MDQVNDIRAGRPWGSDSRIGRKISTRIGSQIGSGGMLAITESREGSMQECC